MSSITLALGPSMMNVKCRCGHEADYMEFRATPISGELPSGHMQCPTCRRAWTVQRGKPRVGWSGMILPGESQIVELNPTL